MGTGHDNWKIDWHPRCGTCRLTKFAAVGANEQCSCGGGGCKDMRHRATLWRWELQHRAADRSDGWTFVVNWELRFNHIARRPNPLWRESQGSFRASSADLTHTSSLAWVRSLFSTRQAICSELSCCFYWHGLFTSGCCSVVLSEYNAYGRVKEVKCSVTAFDMEMWLNLNACGNECSIWIL